MLFIPVTGDLIKYAIQVVFPWWVSEFAFLLLYIIIWKMGFLFRLLTQGFHRVQKYAIRWKSLLLCVVIGCIEEPLMSPEKNGFLNFETRRNTSLMHVIICGNKIWPSCITVAAQSMKFLPYELLGKGDKKIKSNVSTSYIFILRYYLLDDHNNFVNYLKDWRVNKGINIYFNLFFSKWTS